LGVSRGGDVGKGCRRVNMIQILCTYLNGKMRPIETIPGTKGGEIKENDGGSEINYDIFNVLWGGGVFLCFLFIWRGRPYWGLNSRLHA
jgi:hypothetical protein